ncbi:hypothetical protein GCM10028807_47140 [Spirosoma daeguense]
MNRTVVFTMLLLGWVGSCPQLQAQNKKGNEPKNTFIVKAKTTPDSVILRWQPTNELLWKVANQVGYTVERYTVSTDTTKRWERKVFSLKPWQVADWQKNAPTDTMGAVMATMAFENRSAGSAGNSLGAIVQVKYDNDNRFFLSMLMASYYPAQAERMGLRLADHTVQKGQKYLYKIYAPTSQKKIQSDTALVYVDTDKSDPLPTLPEIKAENGDRSVRLKWNRIYADLRFTGYYYERSDDGGRTFRRRNTRPFVQVFSNVPDEVKSEITINDSLPQNYRKYEYRVIGITPFGDLTAPSPVLVVIGHDLVPPSPVTNLKAVNTEGSTVQLSWTKTAREGDLAGYNVSKSASSEGPFLPMTDKPLPPNATTFIDRTANEFNRNFYVVTAVDTAGNVAPTMPAYVAMKDRGAPAKPDGLSGKIDSTGHVALNWKRNAEPDLLGYMVYVANAPDHAFTPLTPDFLADESYRDSITLRTLSEKIYYRVVAFDKSRRASPYSEILELKKPDRVPPVSPVFDKFLAADSSVTLHWANSSSDDIVSQLLYRKEAGKDADYQLLTKVDRMKSEFVDRTVLPRHEYQYVVVAVDESQNQSPRSFPQRVRTYDSGVRKGVNNVTVSASAGQPVQLRWTGSGTGRVLIYRKVGEQPLRIIDNVPVLQQSYQDGSAQKGTYQYALKIVYADGGESPLSSFVQVVR